jgi:hypothetical protein
VRKHPVRWFGCRWSGAQCSGCFCFRPRPASSFLSLSQPALLPSACGLLRSPLLAAIISPPCCLCGHLTSNFLTVRSLKLLTPPNAPTPSCVLAVAGWCPPACLPAARLLCGRRPLLPLCPSEKSEPGVQQRCGGGSCRCANAHTLFHPCSLQSAFLQKQKLMFTTARGTAQRAALQHCRAVTICFVRNSHVRVVKTVVSASEYTAPADPLHCCW